MEYIAYLHKDRDSDYGVSFPDFPGCITAGRTLDEASRLAGEALALHIQEVDSLRARMNPTDLVLPDRLIAVLPEIAAQLSVIWAEYDQPHPAPAVQEAVLRRYRPEIAFRVIPDAGHWVMYDQAAAFNRVAQELLARPLARG